MIPARLDDAELPFEFSNIHTADLIGWKGQLEHTGFRNLRETVAGKVRAPTEAGPQSLSGVRSAFARSPPPRRNFTTLRNIVTVALAIIVLTGGVVITQRIITKRIEREDVETVVLLRNAEKPAEGRPLDCKGLNRALALPGVLQDQFGKPDALFAPQSSDTSSLRPFATLEPTSNIFGLTVDESIGRENVELLVKTLTRSLYRNALVVVAWPHINIPDIARRLLSHHGIADAGIVEHWPADDYDSMYVLKINWTEQKGSFEKKSEGLDTLPETCPRSMKPDG